MATTEEQLTDRVARKLGLKHEVVREVVQAFVAACAEEVRAGHHLEPPQLEALAAQPSQRPPKRRMTAKDLLESGLVGLWKDRDDIGDSVEFAHKLRERAQGRRKTGGCP